jgi:hypothetical protein
LLPQALTKLEDYGFIASKPKGEYHANNQAMSKLLHKAIGLGGKEGAGQVRWEVQRRGGVGWGACFRQLFCQ